MPDFDDRSPMLIHGQATPFREGVQILRWDSATHKPDTVKPKAKYRYWLHYGYKHNTGHFKTYKQAVAWYEHGGR